MRRYKGVFAEESDVNEVVVVSIAGEDRVWTPYAVTDDPDFFMRANDSFFHLGPIIPSARGVIYEKTHRSLYMHPWQLSIQLLRVLIINVNHHYY